MKIQIETYKDNTIYYDIDDDKFTCDMQIEDVLKSSKRASLKDMRSEREKKSELRKRLKPIDLSYLKKTI